MIRKIPMRGVELDGYEQRVIMEKRVIDSPPASSDHFESEKS